MNKKFKYLFLFIVLFLFLSINKVTAEDEFCKYLTINTRSGNYYLYSKNYDPANAMWGGYKHTMGYYLMAYTAKSSCNDGKEVEYDAICIDPARDNPKKTPYTITNELDLDTVFGRAIYFLYTDYYLNNKTDEGLFIATQVARFLVKNYTAESGGFLTGNHTDNLNSYLNDAITPASAAAIYTQVETKAKITTKDSILYDTAKLEIEKSSGDDVKTGIKFSLTVSNVEDVSKIGDLKVTITNSLGEDITNMFTIEGLNNWQKQDKNSNTIITVKSNGNFDKEICNIKIKVSGNYTSDSSLSNVFIVSASSENAAGSYQRFLIFNKENAKSTNIETEIETSTSESCGEDEAKCFTFQSFLCLPTTNTNLIVEGVNLNTMAVDWDNCVIDKQDPAGNNYNVVENDYCKISCKEDFAFRLPGGLGEFSQGRYIPVNLDGYKHTIAGVATQKSCVTSEILVDQYIEDATTLKNNMLTYLNRYYYYIGMLKWLLTPENIQKYKNEVQIGSAGCGYNVSNVVCFPTSASPQPLFKENYLHDYNYNFEYEQYEFEYSDDEKKDVISAKIVKKDETFNGNSSKDASFIGEIEGEDNPNIFESIVNALLGLEKGTIPGNNIPHVNTTSGVTILPEPGVPCTAVWTCNGAAIPPETAKNVQVIVAIAKVINLIVTNANNYNDTRDLLIEKTNYIKDCTRWSSGKNYEFGVSLDFNYEEKEYINMILNDTKLVTDNEPKNPFSYNLYCKDMTEVSNMYTSCKPAINIPSTGNSLLDSLASVAGDTLQSSLFGIEKKDVQIPNSANLLSTGASLIDLGIISDKSYVSLNLDDYYFYVRRLASVAMYGYTGVGLNAGINTETVISLFIQEAIRTFSDKAFIYFKPKYSFYTTPDKGIVSLTPLTEDSEYIDEDGLVYPIKLTTQPGSYLYKLTFNGVGQMFNNESRYGRILGDSGYVSILPSINISTGIGIIDSMINNAIGSITGYKKNDYLCDYSVCAVDDPNCEDTPTTPSTEEEPGEGAECKSIYSSDLCRNDSTLDDCISTLLTNSCCDYVDALGKMVISQDTIDQYNAVCGKNFCCSGTGVIDGGFSSSIGGSPGGGNNNYVNNASTSDGKLEFFSKVVSLNNLFPNKEDSRGFNWIGETSDGTVIDSIIDEIQEKGESIYSEEPVYSLVMDAECAAKIREYNKQQEITDLGFNDYTLVNYDSQFLNELSSYGCIITNDNTDKE